MVSVPKWKKLVVGFGTATAISIASLPYFIGEKVVDVKDGDSFVLQNRQMVRLFGVDAPEKGNCYSEESKAYLTKLIMGKRIILRQPITDQFRRVVALVYLPNGKLINAEVVRNGFAVFTRSGQGETMDMKSANEYARANNLGIFSAKCYGFNPPDPTCVIKGNLDRDKKQLTYMLPGCSYYAKTAIEQFRGEKWFCTETEAQKSGFTKHFTCR